MFSRWHRAARERCHLGRNYQLPDAVAASDCRRLSANLRNFSQSLDLQLVPARRSSRAAGDSSAAVWVAALGQNCIDVLICSMDFLLLFQIDAAALYVTTPHTNLNREWCLNQIPLCYLIVEVRKVKFVRFSFSQEQWYASHSGSFLQFLNFT